MEEELVKPEFSDVQQENSTDSTGDHEPIRSPQIAAAVPKSIQPIVRTTSVVAILLAIGFFICAFAFQRRGLTDDSLAAVASAVIGSIFLLAGVAVRQIKFSISTGRTREESFAKCVPNRVMRIIAFLLGSISVLGGIDFLRMAAIVLNQEYLHWFKVSWSYHSSHDSPAALIAEFHAFGLGVTGIGVFLLWYAVWPLSLTRFSHRVRHMIWFRSTDTHCSVSMRLSVRNRRQPTNSNTLKN